jgi:hypothetical protein
VRATRRAVAALVVATPQAVLQAAFLALESARWTHVAARTPLSVSVALPTMLLLSITLSLVAALHAWAMLLVAARNGPGGAVGCGALREELVRLWEMRGASA